jgi:hypothetical protein
MSAHGPGARESSLKLALGFCIIDLALMGTVAFNSNSVTILGDVLKEGTDTLAVLAAFLTVRAVRRSPNHRFAYGIGKLENLVSIGIGGMMVLAALYITAHAAPRRRPSSSAAPSARACASTAVPHAPSRAACGTASRGRRPPCGCSGPPTAPGRRQTHGIHAYTLASWTRNTLLLAGAILPVRGVHESG